MGTKRERLYTPQQSIVRTGMATLRAMQLSVVIGFYLTLKQQNANWNQFCDFFIKELKIQPGYDRAYLKTQLNGYYFGPSGILTTIATTLKNAQNRLENTQQLNHLASMSLEQLQEKHQPVYSWVLAEAQKVGRPAKEWWAAEQAGIVRTHKANQNDLASAQQIAKEAEVALSNGQFWVPDGGGRGSAAMKEIRSMGSAGVEKANVADIQSLLGLIKS